MVPKHRQVITATNKLKIYKLNQQPSIHHIDYMYKESNVQNFMKKRTL